MRALRALSRSAVAAAAVISLAAPCVAEADTAAFISNTDTLVYTSDPGPAPDPQQALAHARTVCATPHTPSPCPPGSIIFGHPAEASTPNLSRIPGAEEIWAPVSPEDLSDLASYWFVVFVDAPPGASFGSVSVTADDFARVFVNGTEIGSVGSITDVTRSSAHSELTSFDIGSAVRPGRNAIVVNAQNGPSYFSPFCSGPCTYSGNPAFVVFGGEIGNGGPSPVLADHPVSFWRFDETSGTTAHDLVGPNDGSYRGTVALGQPGVFSDDSAVKLDGHGFVRVADSSTLHTGDHFSLEVWCKRASLAKPHTTQGLFLKDAQLYLDGDGFLVFRKPNVGTITRSSTPIADTEFHHVVVTKDGSVVHLYLDGNDVTGAVRNHTITTVNRTLAIGAGGRTPFRGTVDEAAIYSYALDPAQVASHFAAGH